MHAGEPSKLYDDTNPDWIPTLKLGWDTEEPDMARYHRAEQRKRRIVEICEAEVEEENEPQCSNSAILFDADCQTDDCNWLLAKEEEIYAYKLEVTKLKEENYALQKEIEGLKKKLNSTTISPEGLKDDDHKLKFYTGHFNHVRS